jgi:hypothetical protein
MSVKRRGGFSLAAIPTSERGGNKGAHPEAPATRSPEWYHPQRMTCGNCSLPHDAAISALAKNPLLEAWHAQACCRQRSRTVTTVNSCSGSTGLQTGSVRHSVTNNITFNHVNHVLCDIGGHIGQAFNMLGDRIDSHQVLRVSR